MITFNKNSKLARFYLFNYGSLPKSICAYFWGLVLAFALQPLVWPTYLLPKFFDCNDLAERVAACCVSVFIAVSAVVMSVAPWFLTCTILDIPEEPWHYYAAPPTGLVFWACICALYCFVAKTFDRKKKQTSIVWEYVKAKKKKVCPMIEWK